jgi:hypothetical protein
MYIHHAHNYHLSNCLGGLAVAQQKKKAFYHYPVATRSIQQNLSFLQREGLIFSFTLVPSTRFPFYGVNI